ncbi:MAG: STAS domain-containing protein [Treponema sp.]|nr:STAS domain-containing protein [Treponema sp.]
MDNLTIREKVGANYMLLELSGAVNAYTVAELQQKVYSYIIDSNVVLDLSLVTQIDSSGIGVVLAGHNDGEDNGTKLFIMNPSDEARHSLSRTGFWDTFYVIHSVTEVANAS